MAKTNKKEGGKLAHKKSVGRQNAVKKARESACNRNLRKSCNEFTLP